MNKFFLVLLFIVANNQIVWAQSDTTKLQPWKRGGVGNINVSQVSLKNWAAGGQNSVSVLVLANLFSNYKRGNKTLNNTLDLTYGLLKAGTDRIKKSDDRLDLLSKYGFNASKDWYFSTLMNIRSQLTPTYKDEDRRLTSKFLSPAFILASLGMDYKPNDALTIFISPISGKFTLVLDQALADIGSFGVAPAEKDINGNIIPGTGERLRKELGAYLNARYRRSIAQNITLQTKLDLFSNYLRNPSNIDVNWENLINMKVNKFVSVTVFTHLIYDDDIIIRSDSDDDRDSEKPGPKVQFKETLGVGLSYKF